MFTSYYPISLEKKFNLTENEYNDKISTLQTERNEMTANYNVQIGKLTNELRDLRQQTAAQLSHHNLDLFSQTIAK